MRIRIKPRSASIEARGKVLRNSELGRVGVEVGNLDSEQTPNGVNGSSTLFVTREQVTP
jgi:hypothetical protein